MALETGIAVILVTADIIVLIIHICLVMFMAVNATEHGVIGRICMTIGTGSPFTVVLPGIYREILSVMVKC